jgi:hypothetical protein
VEEDTEFWSINMMGRDMLEDKCIYMDNINVDIKELVEVFTTLRTGDANLRFCITTVKDE